MQEKYVEQVMVCDMAKRSNILLDKQISNVLQSMFGCLAWIKEEI